MNPILPVTDDFMRMSRVDFEICKRAALTCFMDLLADPLNEGVRYGELAEAAYQQIRRRIRASWN
jgi:hypothetical protein